MPVKYLVTGDQLPTMDDLEEKTRGAMSEAILSPRTKSRIDTHLLNYADAPFSAEVELRSALYNRSDPFIPAFDVVVDSVAMNVFARKLDGTNIRQFPTLFTLATASPLTWLAASVIIFKFDFYTAAGADQGKAKLSIGTVAEFGGGTQEIWKSTQGILDATLLTSYAGADLALDLIGGRCVFRAAL